MVPVKVTFTSERHEDLTLGPFNQGVVFESKSPNEYVSMINVATREVIAQLYTGDRWHPLNNEAKVYARAFVQAVEPADQVLSMPSSNEAADAARAS